VSKAARPLTGEFVRRLTAAERSAGAAELVRLQAAPSYVKAGKPSDSDFPTPPRIGTRVTDTAAMRVWVRVGVNDWRWIVLNA
jgi:hypothetical protein